MFNLPYQSMVMNIPEMILGCLRVFVYLDAGVAMFNGQSLFDRTMRVKMDGPAGGGATSEPLPRGLKSLGPSLNNLQQMSCMYL